MGLSLSFLFECLKSKRAYKSWSTVSIQVQRICSNLKQRVTVATFPPPQHLRKRGKFFKGALTDGIVIVVVISNRASEIEKLTGNGSQK